MPPALRSLAAGLLAPWLLAGCGPAPEPLPPLLTDGLEATLAPGELHRYRLDFGPEEVIEISVEQRGVDVELRLWAEGRRLTTIDTPNGIRGEERLFALAEEAPGQTLEIVAGEPRAGRYSLRVIRRPADRETRPRLEAERLFARAEGRRREGTASALVEARRLGLEAVSRFEALGEAQRVADCQDREGRMALEMGDARGAERAYEAALPGFRQAGRTLELADSLNGLGRTLRLLGRTEEALAHHQEALAIFRDLDEPEGEARSLNQMGPAFDALGRNREAFEAFELALLAWNRAGRGLERALTYAQRARLRAALGDHQGALDDFQQALPLLADSGRRRHVAAVWVDLGPVFFWLGRSREALEAGERGLALSREVEDQPEVARALTNLAWLELAMERPELSELLARQARELFEELGDRQGGATASLWLGQALAALDRASEAEEVLNHARREFLALGHAPGITSSAQALAKTAARQGDLERALAWIENALAGVEGLRRRVASGEQRADMLAKRSEVYEQAVDILARLESRRPGSGFGWRALAVLEQGKARSLLDALAEAPGEPPVAPATLPALELARRLPSAHSLTIAYALGTERSWLFVVEPGGLRLFELAPRKQLEAAARRARALLAAGGRATSRGQTREALAELSSLLLTPWLAASPPRRLLVVPDGALFYVPFAALSHPASKTAEPLLSSVEITYAPSLSVGARLAERSNRQRAEGLLAVVADPVFSPDDPRLAPASGRPSPPQRLFPRLPYTGREGEALAALARPRPTLLATGFEADRGLLESGRLGRYRYLHFATHAVIDPTVPSLSGLALSAVDPDGRPRDGFVRLTQLARLDLAAELVVLSACESAAGKEVRGEGLVGLAHAFLTSGAQRVLVSLFPVDDQDAAELMQRFYIDLLKKDLSPAAALREAQRALAAEPATAAPAHWASWVLLGPS